MLSESFGYAWTVCDKPMIVTSGRDPFNMWCTRAQGVLFFGIQGNVGLALNSHPELSSWGTMSLTSDQRSWLATATGLYVSWSAGGWNAPRFQHPNFPNKTNTSRTFKRTWHQNMSPARQAQVTLVLKHTYTHGVVLKPAVNLQIPRIVIVSSSYEHFASFSRF